MHQQFWTSFIDATWSRLAAGDKIVVPAYLGHPRVGGFTETKLAEQVGQRSDWEQRYNDGSRLHAHELPSGEFELHRDKVDPNRGLVEATWHWLTESKTGKVAAGLLAAYVAFRVIRTAAAKR